MTRGLGRSHGCTHTDTRTRSHTQTHTHTDTHTRTQRHTHAHTHTHTERETHTDTHTHTDRQTDTHTHTHTHRERHTHTHTQTVHLGVNYNAVFTFFIFIKINYKSFDKNKIQNSVADAVCVCHSAFILQLSPFGSKQIAIFTYDLQ